jgi:hypothetical protein
LKKNEYVCTIYDIDKGIEKENIKMKDFYMKYEELMMK